MGRENCVISVVGSNRRCVCCYWQEDAEEARQARERDEELTKRTLMALNDMRIKFPGKSEEEAEFILDKVGHISTNQIAPFSKL